jgi:hypothetical protein
MSTRKYLKKQGLVPNLQVLRYWRLHLSIRSQNPINHLSHR